MVSGARAAAFDMIIQGRRELHQGLLALQAVGETGCGWEGEAAMTDMLSYVDEAQWMDR